MRICILGTPTLWLICGARFTPPWFWVSVHPSFYFLITIKVLVTHTRVPWVNKLWESLHLITRSEWTRWLMYCIIHKREGHFPLHIRQSSAFPNPVEPWHAKLRLTMMNSGYSILFFSTNVIVTAAMTVWLRGYLKINNFKCICYTLIVWNESYYHYFNSNLKN